jgi:hypothetical protein
MYFSFIEASGFDDLRGLCLMLSSDSPRAVIAFPQFFSCISIEVFLKHWQSDLVFNGTLPQFLLTFLISAIPSFSSAQDNILKLSEAVRGPVWDCIPRMKEVVFLQRFDSISDPVHVTYPGRLKGFPIHNPTNIHLSNQIITIIAILFPEDIRDNVPKKAAQPHPLSPSSLV